ncbi:MAG: glycosyltransferase family 2 protein [Candidatus Omnitrophota bacterium]
MPVYNEAGTISAILRRIEAVDLEKEIIIVDDGSTDGTAGILKKLDQSRYRIIYQPRNRGKGMAIREGLKYATGGVVIIQDADLEYDPRDYHALIGPILKGQASVVYGSRWLRGHFKDIPFNLFKLGSRLLTAMTNVLYRARLTDEPTCYKAFKTEVIRDIKLDCRRFEFCPEITAKILKRGYKIYEVPISYNPRSFKEGKKISWLDGLEAIWILVKNRFTH